MTEPASSGPVPSVDLISERPADHRSVPLLVEHDLGHYPEFREFFRATFDLDRDPFRPPGLLRVAGRLYELSFLGVSGLQFPSGLRISALAPDLEPLDEGVIDGDLWAIFYWMIDGIGGEWTPEDLDATARIYRIRDRRPG
jgi:hypothetical protein